MAARAAGSKEEANRRPRDGPQEAAGAFPARPTAPLRSKPSTEAKITFSLEKRDYGGDHQLSSSSTDALRRAVEISNVPIHLQTGEPLDIAGQVARRIYTFLPVVCGILRPAINHLLTSFLLFFQTVSKRVGVILAKERAKIFFRYIAAFLNVYTRHAPSRRTSIGRLLLRLCLGGL